MDYRDVPMVQCTFPGPTKQIARIPCFDSEVKVTRGPDYYMVQSRQQSLLIPIYVYRVPHPDVDYDTRYAHMLQSIYQLRQTPDYKNVDAGHLAQLADKAIPVILCDSFFKVR